MEEFFGGIIAIVVFVLIAIGVWAVVDYIPDSHRISTGICHICGTEKKNTCVYRDDQQSFVTKYRVCEDCIIDFCRKVKKEEPKEEKKDEK